ERRRGYLSGSRIPVHRGGLAHRRPQGAGAPVRNFRTRKRSEPCVTSTSSDRKDRSMATHHRFVRCDLLARHPCPSIGMSTKAARAATALDWLAVLPSERAFQD